MSESLVDESQEELSSVLPDIDELPAYAAGSTTVDEHVLHLPTPFSFTTPRGYDYLMDSRIKTTVYTFFKIVALFILRIIDIIFLGLRIRGRKHLKSLKGQGFVSVANHVHPLDCYGVALALAQRRTYVVSLESNFRIPVARRLIRVFGGVPLPVSPSRQGEMFRAMKKAMDKNAVVHIYPEAVLKPYDTDLRPFHKGAFYLSAMADAPVLPIVITWRKPRGFYALFKVKPCMTIEILAPLCPDRSLRRQEMVDDLRRRVFFAMREAIHV